MDLSDGLRLEILRGDRALKGKPITKQTVFKSISKEMRQPHPDFEKVYVISLKTCREKWNSMTKSYKTWSSSSSGDGGKPAPPPMSPIWCAEMHHCANVNPPRRVSSSNGKLVEQDKNVLEQENGKKENEQEKRF